MKFICNTEALIESVNIVQKAVAIRSTVEVLEGIKIEARDKQIILVGNDLEISIEKHMEADVTEGGCVVVNSKLFGEIVRKITGESTTIECNENNVTTIKSGNSKFNITGIDATDYPATTTFTSDNFFNLTQKSIKDFIKKTIFAVSTDETKPMLKGCLLEIKSNLISMIAIDGHRLAIKNKTTEDEVAEKISLIIPAKSLNELSKILKEEDTEIKISYNNKNIKFDFDDVIFIARLIEGEYVDYARIIPTEYFYTARVNVHELTNAVERASLVITSEITKNPIILEIDGGIIKITCETVAGKSEEIVTTENTGDLIKIGFNNKFLLEALRACDTEEIILSFVGNVNPCLILPTEGENFKFLLMPVRL